MFAVPNEYTQERSRIFITFLDATLYADELQIFLTNFQKVRDVEKAFIRK